MPIGSMEVYMTVTPYLFFNGNCKEALDFYVETLGGKIEFLYLYKEAPADVDMHGADPESIMHAVYRLNESAIFASDSCGEKSNMSGFSLSICAHDVPEGQKTFDALSAGGAVIMPFGPTFWAEGFGMLTDKFGVSWIVNCEQTPV
jgi:PhnB protein